MVDINPVTIGSVDLSVPGSGTVRVSNVTRTADVNTNGEAQLAYSWAVGVGLIQGIDYSAKYWAQQAKHSSDIAEETIENIDFVAESAVSEITQTKDNAINTISEMSTDSISSIQSATEDAIDDINEAGGQYVDQAQGYANQASSSALSASTDANHAHIWAEGNPGEVMILGGTNSAKGWAEWIASNAPTLTLEQTSTGAIYTATDLNGTTSVTILNGINGITTLSGMTDVDLTNLASGQGLIYNAVTQKWENANITLNNVVDLTSNQIINGRKEFYNLNVTNGNSYGKVATVGGVYNLYGTNNPVSSGVIFGDELLGGNTLRENVRQFAYNSDTDEDELATIFNNANLVAGSNVTITYDSGTGKYSINSSATTITVDQTYDGTSSNPQSGTAVADALDDKQDKLTAGTDLEILNGSPLHNLPSGYTEIEYVQSSGKQYLDTGIAFKDGLRVEVDFQYISLGGTAYTFGFNDYLGYLFYVSSGAYTINSSQSINYSASIYNKNHINATFNVTNNIPTITATIGNETKTFTRNNSGGTIYNLQIFTASGQIGYASIGRCYGVKVYDNDVLVMELVPAIRTSDNKVGMYDTVGNTFKTNSGTGNLIAGAPAVEQTIINFTNESGYITGINSTDVTTALGYTPVNPSSLATVATTGSYNDLADKPYIPSGVIVDQTFDPTSQNAQSGVAINGAGFLTGITSSDVTTALGYTPYNSSNPNGYITSSALNGYATQAWVGQQGYLTSSSISNMQTTGNLVTSISSSSTDSQYPSAKCMYDIIGDIETLLQAV